MEQSWKLIRNRVSEDKDASGKSDRKLEPKRFQMGTGVPGIGQVAACRGWEQYVLAHGFRGLK